MFNVFVFLFPWILGNVIGRKCQTNILDTVEYLGCFVDTTDRLFPKITYLGNSTDNDRCILLCCDFKYMFAGTENAKQCNCGNDPWRYTAADVDSFFIQNYDCDSTCKADPTQICGGWWRMSVYSTGIKNDTPQPENPRTVKKRYSKIGVDRTLHVSKTAFASLFTSQFNCAALCSRNEACTVYVFSIITGKCRMYQLKYVDLCDYIVNEEGSSIYMLKF